MALKWVSKTFWVTCNARHARSRDSLLRTAVNHRVERSQAVFIVAKHCVGILICRHGDEDNAQDALVESPEGWKKAR